MSLADFGLAHNADSGLRGLTPRRKARTGRNRKFPVWSWSVSFVFFMLMCRPAPHLSHHCWFSATNDALHAHNLRFLPVLAFLGRDILTAPLGAVCQPKVCQGLSIRKDIIDSVRVDVLHHLRAHCLGFEAQAPFKSFGLFCFQLVTQWHRM